MKAEQPYLFEREAFQDEEFFGVDGDGLCEGEELYEDELGEEDQDRFFLTVLGHE